MAAKKAKQSSENKKVVKQLSKKGMKQTKGGFAGTGRTVPWKG